MPLELQLKRSRYFYGRIEIGGRSIFLSLRVPVEGKPPSSLREEGDSAFERSRAKAQSKLDRITGELRERATREELAQRVLEARTGSRLGSILLTNLAQRWIELPRPRTPSDRYVADRSATIRRFAQFLREQFPAAKEMADVRDEMAAAFMRSEQTRRISPKTYNEVLKLLRSCFEQLRKPAGLAENPFDGLPTKETDTVHRKPFSVAEVEAILKASKADTFTHRLIVVGACTAMRLGDCAKLQWEHVNLADGFIDVKTSKTRQLATIPIFPALREVLSAVPSRPEGFVFPDLARQYEVNPKLLTSRVRRVMASVGFGDAEDKAGAHTRGAFHATRPVGLRRASIRDFHSFRVTWVTIALNAGVPIDLVRKVTGHQTVEVVLTSYHQPAREDFRRELASRLPSVLTGSSIVHSQPALTKSEIRAKLVAMSDSTWRQVRDELLRDCDSGA